MKKETLIYSCKPWQDPRVKRLEKSDTDIAAELISKSYRRTMDYNKKRISNSLQPLYKTEVKFANRITTDVVQGIKNLQNITQKNISEIGDELRSYINKDFNFFRTEGKKQVPIDSRRLKLAYDSMKNGESSEKVWNILVN